MSKKAKIKKPCQMKNDELIAEVNKKHKTSWRYQREIEIREKRKQS